jgi:hypothetical protein
MTTAPNPIKNAYLNPIKAADLLGTTPKTLADWRFRKCGPRYVKLGTLVKYIEADLHAYMQANIRETGGAA